MRYIFRPFEMFFKHESAGGIALFMTAVLAMIWANSPLAGFYEKIFDTHITIGFGQFSLTEPLKLWINDGLMAVFFFAVGLEIKRELIIGELNSVRKAALPVAGALGGMLLPALIFIALNWNGDNIRGWAIPTATDIAFAMGVMRLLGSRIPRSAVVFLTALAIVDDIGAVLIIALVYTSKLNLSALAIGMLITALLLALNRFRVSALHVYFIGGIILWFAFFKSGIHPTVAGVLLGLLIPVRHRKHHRESPLHRAEKALLPWVSFFIMPVFALANAGIKTDLQLLRDIITQPLAIGIAVGLFAGKQLGITLFSFVSVKLKLASLPKGADWKHIYGTAIIGGIGFTMSLFVADLALGGSTDQSLAKLSIIVGSLLSGLVGAGYILLTGKSAADRKVVAVD